MVVALGTPVAVYVRLRKRSSSGITKIRDDCIAVQEEGAGTREVVCDGVLEDDRSDHVYARACRTLPQQLSEGHCCTVMSIGGDGFLTETTTDHKSVLQHMVQDIFECLTKSACTELTLRCSIVELNGSGIRDLLYDASLVRISYNGKLTGCAAVSCCNSADVMEAVEQARKSENTRIVQLVLEQNDSRQKEAKESHMLLVDFPESALRSVDAASASLRALHEMVREEIGRQASLGDKAAARGAQIPKEGPILCRILGNSFGGTAYTAVIMRTPTQPKGSIGLFKFLTDCRNVVNHPRVHVHHRWQDCQQQVQTLHRKQEQYEVLARALADECLRLRRSAGSKMNYQRNLWNVIEEIKQTQQEDRSIDFTIEKEGEHQLRIEMTRARAELRKTEVERDEAVSKATRLQAEFDTMRTEIEKLRKENEKSRSEINELTKENRILKKRDADLQQDLQTSLFRENEATVYLRQFRKFYYRLLKKEEEESNGEMSTVVKSIPGAPDLTSLVDMDQMMIESGLLEEKEKGQDISAKEHKPSKDAIDHSKAALQAAKDKLSKDLANETNSKPLLGVSGISLSLVSRHESGEVTEARQRVFQTPAGRFIEMREKLLEQELLETTAKCSKLELELSQEKEHVAAMKGNRDAVERLNSSMEYQLLKEKLERREKDLKAVIWKMNELHVTAKASRDKSTNLEKQISVIEDSMKAVESRSTAVIDDAEATEKKLIDEIAELRKKMDHTWTPVWASDDKQARPPLKTRLVVPFGTEPKPDDLFGTSEKLVHLYSKSQNKVVADVATQTDGTVEVKMGVSRALSHLSPEDYLFMDDSFSENDKQKKSSATTRNLLSTTKDEDVSDDESIDLNTVKNASDVTLSPQKSSSYRHLEVSPSPAKQKLNLSAHGSDRFHFDGRKETELQRPKSNLSYDQIIAKLRAQGTPIPEDDTILRSNLTYEQVMERLRAQAAKKAQEDDSGIPEFMRMFKKIGAKNAGEAVIETQGAAAAQELTRTAYGEHLKLNERPKTVPIYSSSTIKWKSTKKKSMEDSMSSVDSFAARFLGGGVGGESSYANESSSHAALDQSVSLDEIAKDEEAGDRVVKFATKSDSVIGVADFIDTASYGSIEHDKSPWSDSESTLEDKSKPETSGENKAEGKEEVKEEKEEEKEKVLPWMRPNAAPPKPPGGFVASAPTRSEATTYPSPAPEPASITKENEPESNESTPTTKTATGTEKDESESDEEEKIPPWKRPGAAPPKPPGETVPTSTLSASPTAIKEDDSDSSDSDEEEKIPPWKRPGAAPPKPPVDVAQVTPAPVATPAPAPSPVATTSKEEDSESEEEEKIPPWKRPGAAPPKPPMAMETSTTTFQAKEESPRKIDAPEVQPEEESESEEASEDDGDKNAAANDPPQPIEASESEDSSADEVEKPDADDESDAANDEEPSGHEEAYAEEPEADASSDEEQVISKPTPKAQTESESESSADEEEIVEEEIVEESEVAEESLRDDDDSTHAASNKGREVAANDESESGGDEEEYEEEEEEEVEEEEDHGFGTWAKPEEKKSKPSGRKGSKTKGSADVLDRIQKKFAQQKGKRAKKPAPKEEEDDPFSEASQEGAIDPFASTRHERTSVNDFDAAFGSDPFATSNHSSNNSGMKRSNHSLHADDDSSSSDEDESSKGSGYKPQRKVPDFGSQITPSLSQAANTMASKGKGDKKPKFIIKGGKLVKSGSSRDLTESSGKSGNAPSSPTKSQSKASSKKAPSKKGKAKFVIKGGRLVKDDSDIVTSLSSLAKAEGEGKMERRNSLDSKTGAVEEEERMSRRDQLTKEAASKKKPDKSLFIIKNGKLVKASANEAPPSPAPIEKKAASKPAFTIVGGKLVKTGDTSKKSTSAKETPKASGKSKGSRGKPSANKKKPRR